MKQRNLHSIKHHAFIIMTALIFVVTACDNNINKYSFESPKEALRTCHIELSKIKNIKNADIKQLATITENWLLLQDSSLSCFMRDSTVLNSIEISADFFAVSDSFRTEITRLALADCRTMRDIIELKVMTAHDRPKLISSKTYKDAVAFYERMDDAELYKDMNSTIFEYEKLLANADPFKKEQQLHQFIKQEDRCFRSLLTFLMDVPQERLQTITNLTSNLFDELYKNTMADLDNEVNERVMIYLTMRFNRRIIQNAEVCRNDIKKHKILNNQQATNYRWMIIQPFMTIDNYAMALLTDKQIEQLTKLADELPELLAILDGNDYQKATKEETEKVESVLSEYFLKTYLKSIL